MNHKTLGPSTRMNATKPEVKVSTITMTTRLPYDELYLTNIGKYLDIDNDIIGIKFKYADAQCITKGSYHTSILKNAKMKDASKVNKSLFYNQVTVIVNNKGNHVNVKIFGNGSLHLTGCKSVDDGDIITGILHKKLMALSEKTDTTLLAKDCNGVLSDKDNMVYSYSTKNIIGYTNDRGVYVIRKKEYEIDPRHSVFIAKKQGPQRKRQLLNFDGEDIGYCQLKLLRNHQKFYKSHGGICIDYDDEMIYANNNTIIGTVEYVVDTNRIQKDSDVPDVLEVTHQCNAFKSNDGAAAVQSFHPDVNCMNVYFNINYTINRNRLYEQLISLDYICKYKPESYSGVKVVYKVQIDADSLSSEQRVIDGHCRCTMKCTCQNITFIIFQTGNVIATGFKNPAQVTYITDFFISLISYLENTIKTRC